MPLKKANFDHENLTVPEQGDRIRVKGEIRNIGKPVAGS